MLQLDDGLEMKRSNSLRKPELAKQQKSFFSKSHSRENKENEDRGNLVKEFVVADEKQRKVSDANLRAVQPTRKNHKFSSDQAYLGSLVTRIKNHNNSLNSKPLTSLSQHQEQLVTRDKAIYTFHQQSGSITTPKDVLCRKKPQFQFLNELMGKIYMNKNLVLRQRTQTS